MRAGRTYARGYALARRTPRPARSKKLPAFTLIELLIALAVLSVIAGLSVTTFASVRRASERSREGEELVREVRTFLERLDMELAAAVYHPEIDWTGFSSRRVALGPDDASTLAFAAIVPQSPYELTRRGEIIRVAYAVERNPDDDLLTLTKRVWLNTFAVEGHDEPVELTVRGDFSAFDLRFEKGGRWFDDWESDDMGGLPRGVELRFTVGGREYFQRFDLYVAELG